MKRRAKYLLTLLLCVLTVGCGEGSWSSGDRVLVGKFLYDANLAKPERWDVVVFKYPERPISNGTPKNYIKRLLGLPGELLAIFFGQIYVALEEPVDYANADAGVDPNDLWKAQYLHTEYRRPTEPKGNEYWQTRRFQIKRKSVDTMLAMRRSVFDNDFQPKDLKNVLPPRWQPKAGWEADGKTGFRSDGSQAELAWLRYQHILRTSLDAGKKPQPQLITDFLGYNQFVTNGMAPQPYDPHRHNWVGDLMLECKVKIEKGEGELVMELSRGVDRFQATFDLAAGTCTLTRHGEDGKPKRLESKTTALKGPGTHDLRFANFDNRLTVWVDGELPFGDGVGHDAPAKRGPYANDLEPASLGSKGAAVQVTGLKLWRDTYYTLKGPSPDAETAGVDYTDPATWGPLRDLEYRTLYVHKGHYLCLGDNSPQSSDSREWGTVPERLMLGRALLVYFPFSRAGRIK